jgi:hypothetical protein
VAGELGHGATQALIAKHFRGGRGSASASEAMRVRVAAPMAAHTTRRHDLRVIVGAAFGPMPTSSTRSARCRRVGHQPGLAELGGESRRA